MAHVQHIHAILGLVFLLGLAGCAAKQLPPADSNLDLTDEEQRLNWTLDQQQQEQVRSVLYSLAEHHQPQQVPASATSVRWDDLELAVHHACTACEMAVVAVEQSERSTRFRLRTANERPGELVVTRMAEAPGYSAAASIGRFSDDQSADDLLAALDRSWRALMRKRGF